MNDQTHDKDDQEMTLRIITREPMRTGRSQDVDGKLKKAKKSGGEFSSYLQFSRAIKSSELSSKNLGRTTKTSRPKSENIINDDNEIFHYPQLPNRNNNKVTININNNNINNNQNNYYHKLKSKVNSKVTTIDVTNTT